MRPAHPAAGEAMPQQQPSFSDLDSTLYRIERLASLLDGLIESNLARTETFPGETGDLFHLPARYRRDICFAVCELSQEVDSLRQVIAESIYPDVAVAA